MAVACSLVLAAACLLACQANILLATATGVCKLCDFGLSSANDAAERGSGGTLEYSSPEALRGQVADYRKTDTYVNRSIDATTQAG